MTVDEIETALGQRLETMTGVLPIAWPNRDFEPSGKYCEFRHSPGDVVDPVVSGGFDYREGIALITVAVPSGEYTALANVEAQKIADRFPKALRLPAGNGNVVISAPSSPRPGFQSGDYWRVPVRVSYITE